MPLSRTPSGRLRDYKKEAAHNRTPRVQAERVRRNRARRAAIRMGKAKVGDGTHVDHIDGNPFHTPKKITASNFGANLRVISAKANERKQ